MEERTHLQRAVARALDQLGISARELSRRIGPNDSLIKSILTGKSRNPRADTLQKIARETGLSLAELTGDAGTESHAAAGDRGFHEEPRDSAPRANGSMPFRAAIDVGQPRDLPVYGRAVGGEETWFEFNGEAMDWLFRPSLLNGAREAYAMFVSGSSMEPRYMEGETVYVNPARPVRVGDFVVALLQPKAPGAPARGLVKQLAGRSNGRILLRSLNPPDAPLLELPAEEVVSVHRIVLSGES
jgi:phage repressor protein C with HTH and peptisase S24 domain